MHKYLLRIPVGLWDRLCEVAKENERSVNAEIVWRLRRSLEGWTR